MSKTVVIGDVHNRRDKLWSVLAQSGAVDEDTGQKDPDTHVIQLGDLVSLGYDEIEADFYTWAMSYIDEALVGNHELASCYFNESHIHLGWDADSWHGWHVGRDRNAERAVKKAFRDGRYAAAASVGPWLITHAGITPRLQKKYGLRGLTASEAATEINALFWDSCNKKGRDPLFEGPESMFWVRIWDLQNGYGDEAWHIPQLVGHTPNANYQGELVKDYLWNLDTPPVHHKIHGGVSALVFDEDNNIERYVYVE